jgi:hypothetical protein
VTRSRNRTYDGEKFRARRRHTETCRVDCAHKSLHGTNFRDAPSHVDVCQVVDMTNAVFTKRRAQHSGMSRTEKFALRAKLADFGKPAVWRNPQLWRNSWKLASFARVSKRQVSGYPETGKSGVNPPKPRKVGKSTDFQEIVETKGKVH